MTAIEGVIISPLKQFPDGRGVVKHMLKSTDENFTTFGEIYFSFTRCGVIKAWKCHQNVVQNLAVPMGEIRLVIYDDRPSSSTRGNLIDMTIGDANYVRVQLPPRVLYGFQALSPQGALVANCLDKPYNSNEAQQYDLDSAVVPFKWGD